MNSSSTTLGHHLSSDHQIFCSVDQETDDDDATNKSNLKEDTGSKLSPKKQQYINDLLIKFIIDNFQAFNITSNQSFLNFVNSLEPRYIVPDPKTIKQKVVEKFDSLQPKVEKLLKESDSLKSWTTDGWSASTTEPFLILTSAFIDKDFTYFNITWDFSLFPHPHDAISMSEKLFEVFITNFKNSLLILIIFTY